MAYSKGTFSVCKNSAKTDADLVGLVPFTEISTKVIRPLNRGLVVALVDLWIQTAKG